MMLKCLCVWLLVVTVGQGADIASVFSDHMVLQQGMPVPIWGTGKGGESVTVTFAGQERSTQADDKGRWMVRLDPLAASAEPGTLTVRSADADITISDVLVGEVWLASGQSNMAFGLSKSTGTPEAKAPDPLIRLLQVPRKPIPEPAESIQASWTRSDGKNLGGFSAVGYFFAKHLAATRKVPIGIINSSVGGTPAQAWTPREAMTGNPKLKPLITEFDKRVKTYDPVVEATKYKDELAKYEATIARNPEAKQKNGRPLQSPNPPVEPSIYQRSPTTLYNGMIAPLVPMAIRGVIFYQGEGDSGAAELYRTQFPTLIQSWRKDFGHEFPFLFVQIAPHQNMVPEIRDAQLFTWKTVPKTAMAVITDYGHPTDIHPVDKQPVGERLALAARALAYGENIVYSGPLFDTLEIRSNQAVLSFKHVGDGLVAKTDTLVGFEVSGGGTNFVPASATIEGDTVVVTSDKVEKPVAVRYGWSNIPEASLYNKNGLPATPFQCELWQ